MARKKKDEVVEAKVVSEKEKKTTVKKSEKKANETKKVSEKKEKVEKAKTTKKATKKKKEEGYFSKVRKEMKKVVWPKGMDVLKYTLAVIIFCLMLGLFFALIDLAVAFVKGLFV